MLNLAREKEEASAMLVITKGGAISSLFCTLVLTIKVLKPMPVSWIQRREGN